MDNPFTIDIYDKAFARVGWINDPISLEATPRHNAIGTATLTVASSHRRLPLLAASGARLWLKYNGEHLMSGPIIELSGRGPTSGGEVSVTMQDDLCLIWRLLGWPVPGAAIDAQGTKKDKRTGAAETVAKGFISANKAHLTDTITVAADLGRGSSITVESRMAVLGDVLMEPVDKAGIGLSVRQSGAGLLVDAYAPATFPRALSEDAGTILNWEWSKAAPTSTRVIVGGPNTDTSREFRRVIDATRETALGYSIETFVDGQSSESYADMDAAGQKALDEAAAKSGLKVELSETKAFRYGGSNGVHVGDQVTFQIGTTTITDVLREAVLKWNADDGLLVTPTVGEKSDDPDITLASRIAALAKGLRDLRTR